MKNHYDMREEESQSSLVQEEQAKLQAKINAGIKDIREGKGVSREENETTAQFFERLCIE